MEMYFFNKVPVTITTKCELLRPFDVIVLSGQSVGYSMKLAPPTGKN